MADVNRGDRPLSPHLQVYKFEIPAISSILTRITGNALIVGALMFVWWLLAAASSPEYFAIADAVWTSWFGWLVQLGSVWALWYHALAGARHLYWDTGRGLELDIAEKLGWACVGGSVILTILTFIIL
ncbi:MAG: succinate dehydrogenase, cytochrome b556 subunit [Pseudomonadota bacterium]